MVNYKLFLAVLLLFSFSACKKDNEAINVSITTQQVAIESITSNQIDISYQLSRLGYDQTGVSYHKKSLPGASTTIYAIRKNDLLKLSLQNLEAGTEYVIKIFYKKDNQTHLDSKEYSLKTLSAEAAKFNLNIVETNINYDDEGNFSFNIEGENLQNFNLSELVVRVNVKLQVLSYPSLITANRYKMKITGIVDPVNGNYPIQFTYQGKELLFKSLPFSYNGERYLATYEPTNLKGSYASVFNNQLYYFADKKVSRWDEVGQRMLTLGNFPAGINGPFGDAAGTAFDGILFLPAVNKTIIADLSKPFDYTIFPEAYAYIPSTNDWLTFSFKELEYTKNSLIVSNCNYFVHKNVFYLAFSVGDNPSNGFTGKPTFNKYVYRYSSSGKSFEKVTEIKVEMTNFHFVSVNNELYLLGNVPVVDQGFKLSSVFAVYRVSDQFSVQEEFRAGTLSDPINFTAKKALAYDRQILIATGVTDLKLYDPIEKKLSKVHPRNNITNTYLGGFFTYNNKLHLNTDIGFNSQTIYEFSITKGR